MASHGLRTATLEIAFLGYIRTENAPAVEEERVYPGGDFPVPHGRQALAGKLGEGGRLIPTHA